MVGRLRAAPHLTSFVGSANGTLGIPWLSLRLRPVGSRRPVPDIDRTIASSTRSRVRLRRRTGSAETAIIAPVQPGCCPLHGIALSTIVEHVFVALVEELTGQSADVIDTAVAAAKRGYLEQRLNCPPAEARRITRRATAP